MLEFYGFSFILFICLVYTYTYCIINTVKETQPWRFSGHLNTVEVKNQNVHVKEEKREKKGFQVILCPLEWDYSSFWPLEIHFIQWYDPTDFPTGTNNNSYNPTTDRRNIKSSSNKLFHNNTVLNVLEKKSYYRLGDPPPPPPRSQTLKKLKHHSVSFFYKGKKQ